MSDPYFTVFKEHYDHKKWEKQKEYASLMEGIEETLREKFISALDFLEKEFGKGFLKTSHVNHPLRQVISGKAEWQIEELIAFATTIQKLKVSQSNYPKLKSKLLSLEKAKLEGMPFVEIAECYLKENFRVNFLEETNKEKIPDIEIINPENDDRFFIEVSMVKESDKRKFIHLNYDFLFRQFHFLPPKYPSTGKQKTFIAIEDYPEIKQIIWNAKKQDEETQQMFSYSDERLEFTLAPVEMIEELDKICEQNGTRRNDITGLPLNFDETERVISKLSSKKGKQIPQDSNGIIYFPVTPLFFMSTDLTGSVSRLEDYITKFTNILGIVLYSEALHSQAEQFIEAGKHFFSRKMFGGVLCRELLFVYNNNCELMIKKETMKKIYSTFK